MFLIRYALRLFLLLFSLCLCIQVAAQSSFPLEDGRGFDACSSCETVLNAMPREVLFGIHISGDGNITFSINSVAWFHKIFNNQHMGVAADLVSRSRYNCNSVPAETEVTKGFVIKPVYRDELVRRADTIGGQIQIPIGKVPPHLRNEILEGNLIIVNKGDICRYSFMIDIERDVLDLLPMGLYTDTLLQQDFANDTDTSAIILYSVKKTITLPFKKGGASFQPEDLQLLRDSLGAGKYNLRHLELRAYSSVEGPEEANRQLMKKRANAVLNAIATIAPGRYSNTIIPAENWIEFTRDAIPLMPRLAGMSKKGIKQQLQDKSILNQLEPTLAKHRKAVITVWLDNSTHVGDMANDALIPAFNRSVKERNIADGRKILKEIAVRIAEDRLPDDYINNLEVPNSVEYQDLISDQAIYRFYLEQAVETEALSTLYTVRKNKPEDPFLNYNICVLELVALKYHTAVDINAVNLEAAIKKLGSQGIHPSLVERMLINYHIILCEKYMQEGNYAAKDGAVEYISEAFKTLTLNDQALYSLAQFFTAYERLDLAMEIIRPRVNQLDAGENIIFYFINLCFFHNEYYERDDFANAVLNAANLNRARFCQFFQPGDRGGASFQLLESDILRKYKCDNCPQ